MSTTFSSGKLSDAIAKWQVTAEAEGHGKYVTTNTDEETVGNVYERMFEVIFAAISHWDKRPQKGSFRLTLLLF